MAKILSQVLAAAAWDGPEGLVLKHWCTGCKSYHRINVEKPNHCGAVWNWNQNVEAPTFSPSVNTSATDPEDGELLYRCHYFVTDGQILYCGDCTHELSGKTVELPRLPILPDDSDLDFAS